VKPLRAVICFKPGQNGSKRGNSTVNSPNFNGWRMIAG
jgi:hypothetical protein